VARPPPPFFFFLSFVVVPHRFRCALVGPLEFFRRTPRSHFMNSHPPPPFPVHTELPMSSVFVAHTLWYVSGPRGRHSTFPPFFDTPRVPAPRQPPRSYCWQNPFPGRPVCLINRVSDLPCPCGALLRCSDESHSILNASFFFVFLGY